MEKIRWGVLSTANIGRTQVIPAIFRAENAEMSAISSRGDRVYAAARELGIPKAYESYEALLDDPEIDAVYIPLPNNLHKEWVIKAAEKGKHVLCEKPAALSAQEAKEMIEACEANGVKFMEAFMYQLHPQHARVKEIIASGEIGEVKLIKSSHSFYLNNRERDIRMDKTMGGGSIYDVGSYCVQVIRHLTDSEPVKVQAIAELDEATGIDLTSTVYMKMDNGIKAMFDCSFDMINRNEYEVIGTEGKIKVPFAFRPDVNGGIGKVIIQNNGMIREEKIYGDIYRMEIEQFSRAILDGGEPVITTESTLKNMAVLDKCYESIQNT